MVVGARQALDRAVKQGVSALVYLTFLRCDRIQLSSGPEMKSTRSTGSLPETVLRIGTRESQRCAIAAPTAHYPMNVWVLGIEVGNGNPLQRSAEVPFRLFHNVTGQPFEIELRAELWRDDDLPHPLVTRRLPVAERLRDIDVGPACTGS
jgi:hypothetical protein